MLETSTLRILTISATALIVSCAARPATVTIESEKSLFYDGFPSNIVLVTKAGPPIRPATEIPEPPLHDQLGAALAQCKIAPDGNSGDPLTQAMRAVRREEMAPEVTLFLTWVGGTAAAGQVVRGEYTLAMVDHRGARVWRADITAGYGLRPNTAITKAIINKLVADNLLPNSCSQK